MTDLLGVPPVSQEELRREVERLRLLHSITLEFNATLDFDELLPRVFDRVMTALGAEGGSLWIAEGDMLHCRLAVGGAAASRLVGAQMPAILVEASFITEPREAAALATDEYRQALADGIAEGIEQHLSPPPAGGG